MSSAPCGFTEAGGFAGILGPPQVAENCAEQSPPAKDPPPPQHAAPPAVTQVVKQ
jgi:hypothetical protein